MAMRPELFGRYMEFRKMILNEFRSYQVPIIELKKGTSKEAVCLVFEKVNTGGVQLSVFELVTATYAADGFNLRKDWFGQGAEKGRQAKLAAKPLLKDIQNTDFLQGISLLHTYERQQEDIKAGKTGKSVTPVSAKREHILSMPLCAYEKWADKLVAGFFETEQFLRHLGFHDPRFLPYRSQLVPLAATLTHSGDRWLEPQMQDKLSRWYWCGVFGELYGSAIETRIALDLQGLMNWLDDEIEPAPTTVSDAGFQASRLDTMRSRTSAAYRGLYVLLQHGGAKDFFWKAKMVELDRNEKGVDIHHIFPKKWCIQEGIAQKVFNSIVNKTAISYKAIERSAGVLHRSILKPSKVPKPCNSTTRGMNAILKSHCIEPRYLREDEFDGFYESRKASLLGLVESAMGKKALSGENENGYDEESEDDENSFVNCVGWSIGSARRPPRLAAVSGDCRLAVPHTWPANHGGESAR